MTLNQELLNTYFSTAWRERNRQFGNYQYTGYQLQEKILPGERVIDVGCGINPFKGIIPNLTGIDPAFPEADFQLSLEDFIKRGVAERFNVAFCLGSINFGTQEDIEHQISLLMKVLRTRDTRIYWRCNPGQKDHGNTECEVIPFYNWSFEEHLRLAEKFNYEIRELEWDSNNRIYAEWVHKSGPSNTYLST
ncbi:hypothetical protein UFOVP112_426 [uncultured Caudovirales phage]|uniref:Uncharacterized protein n=1 Tax=uncultured Caudovirales phage TaxID=2100421 RepID=A0A6J5L3P7_9CAUD|nr:hypothetical protein UFOVP112_426 [uncultured Caudovirales phage]